MSNFEEIDAKLQDQHTPAFDLFFSQTLSTTTLAIDTVDDSHEFTASPGHGIVAKNQIIISQAGLTTVYIGDVYDVIGDVIYMDRPFGTVYASASAVVAVTTKDLNVDGSVTRQIFSIYNTSANDLDITRFMFMMTTTGANPLDEFGDLPELERGIYLRSLNGIKNVLWNIKTNGEMVNLMFDVTPFSQAGPQGVNGIGARLTYAGQDKHGVVIRLTQGERVDLVVQDPLQTLLSFRMIAGGHVVDP